MTQSVYYQRMAATGRPVVVPDTAADPDWADIPALRWVRSYAGLPIRLRGQVVGFLNLDSAAPGFFTPALVEPLQAFADQAAAAIENARLFAAVQRELAERRQAEEALRQANERLQVQLATIEALQTSLREQAIRDPLTGLFNRRYFEEAFDQGLARAERDEEPVCLVLIDLDRFKTINDAHGHHAGDAVLRALARLLLAQTRRSDSVCRYGGEEFLVALPTMPLPTAHQRAEGWRQAFAALETEVDGARLRATFSAGVAAFPAHGRDRVSVLAAADRALYAAKSAGRNRVVAAG